MENKIVLADLDRLLFPERYPFCKDNWKAERKALYQLNYAATSYRNLKFKVRLAQYCMHVEEEEARNVMAYLLEQHVDTYYDWHKAYDWYELKSILFHCKLFSSIQSANDIFKLLKNPNILRTYKKYLPIKPHIEHQYNQ